MSDPKTSNAELAKDVLWAADLVVIDTGHPERAERLRLAAQRLEAPVTDEQSLRNILAEEMERNGERGLASAICDGYDNSHGGSHGGTAALAAMKRVVAPPVTDSDWCAGYDQAMKEMRERPVTDAMVDVALRKFKAALNFRHKTNVEAMRAALTAALQGDGGMMAAPLKKTYSKSHPYVVERHDWDDGTISYEIWDYRPDSYRRLCSITEGRDSGTRGKCKEDAEMIARALNLMNGGLP
jgi:hypothetical protein